tara:strand:- start:275 stop:478 length:204 start_codon:yes stop_codon:yes gene_type:complete
MVHKITEKKLLIRQQLENIVAEHNKTAQLKEQLFNQATELQGALKVLEELDYVPTDQPTDTEPTEGS